MVNGGFFVLNRRIFDYMTEDETCDFEYGALERVAEDGEMMVYRHDGFWACMDTLRDMEYLNRLWAEGKAAWKLWDQHKGGNSLRKTKLPQVKMLGPYPIA